MWTYPFGAGGIVTRLITSGNSGEVVVLLHGFTSRADRWRGTVGTLAAQGYRVFAPDLPGHGFATKDPAFDHSVSGYRDFVLDLIEQLGLDRINLVGTSLGGHVAAAVAACVPDLVGRLVMIGSMGLDQLPSERIAAIRGGLADMSFAAVRTRLLTVFNDPALVTDDLVREDMLVNTSPGAVACLQKFGTYLASSFNKELAIDDLVALDAKVPLLLNLGRGRPVGASRRGASGAQAPLTCAARGDAWSQPYAIYGESRPVLSHPASVLVRRSHRLRSRS